MEDVPPETKRCSKGDDCKNEGGPDQPLANFNFNTRRGRLLAECKSCQYAYYRARRSKLNNPRSTEPKICSNKKCAKAGQLQPASCFTTHRDASDGLSSNCKACQNATKTASAHVFIRILFNAAKRRESQFDMTLEDWLAIYDAQEGKCALSGIEMTFTLDKNPPTFNASAKKLKWPFNISPDQIDAGKGYVRGNVQFVCAQVNMMKAELSIEALVHISRKIVDHHS